MLRLLLAGAIALAASQCAWDNSRALSTPTDGAPCGNAGVVCYSVGASGAIAPTGMCCYEGSVCGGGGYINVGCPAGECCYEGTDALAGAAPPRPQWRAR